MSGKGRGTTIGIYGVYTAIIKQDTLDALIYGANKEISALATSSREVASNEFQGWYNDVKKESLISEGNTVINLTGQDLAAEDIAIMLGKLYDPATDTIYDDGSQANAPYMSCSYTELTADGAVMRQLHKGKWIIGNKEAATKKEGGLDPKLVNLVYNALTTIYEYDVSLLAYKMYDAETEAWVTAASGTMRVLKELEKRYTIAEYEAGKTAWYAAVQLPETSSASAIALSLAAPADGDTGVLITVEPALTFNNAISSYSITLLDGTTPIDTTIEKNATGKIITTTPDASLDAATLYTLVYDVIDVYGQRLQGAVEFTTA